MLITSFNAQTKIKMNHLEEKDKKAGKLETGNWKIGKLVHWCRIHKAHLGKFLSFCQISNLKITFLQDNYSNLL